MGIKEGQDSTTSENSEINQQTLASLPPKELLRAVGEVPRITPNSADQNTAGAKGKQPSKAPSDGGLNMSGENVPRATTFGKQTGENPKQPKNEDINRETSQERQKEDLPPISSRSRSSSSSSSRYRTTGPEIPEEGGLNMSEESLEEGDRIPTPEVLRQSTIKTKRREEGKEVKEGQNKTAESFKNVKLNVKSDTKKTIELDNAIDALFSQVEKMSPVNVVDLRVKIERKIRSKIQSVNLKNLSNNSDTLKEIRASAKELVKESFSDLIYKYYVLNEKTKRYNDAKKKGDEAYRDAKEGMEKAAFDVQKALHALAPAPAAAAAPAPAEKPFDSILPNGETNQEKENFIKFVLISVLAQIYADFPVDTHLLPATYTKIEQYTVSKFIAGSNWNPLNTAILRSNLICNGATMNALQDDFLKIQRSDGVSDQSKNKDALTEKLTLLTDYLAKSDYAIRQEVIRANGKMPWGQLILSNFRGKEQFKAVGFRSTFQTLASAVIGLVAQRVTMTLTPMKIKGFCEEDSLNKIPTAENYVALNGSNVSSSSNGSSNGSSSFNGIDNSIALNNDAFTMMRNNSRSLAGNNLTYQFEYSDNNLCSCLETFLKDNEKNLKELSKNSKVLKKRLYDAIAQDFIDKGIGVYSLSQLKKHIDEESFNRVLSDVKHKFGPVRAKSSFMDEKDYTDREIMLFDFLISLVRGVVAPVVDSYSEIEKSNGEISASLIQQTLNGAWKQRYTGGASIVVIALVNAYNERPEWFEKSDLMVNLVITPFTTALIDVCRNALKDKGFMIGPFMQELAKGGSRTIVRLCVQVLKDRMEGKLIDLRALALITGGGAFKEFFGCVNQGLSNVEGYLQSPLGTAQQCGDEFITAISQNKGPEGAEIKFNPYLSLLSKQYRQAPEFARKQPDYMFKAKQGTRDVIDKIPRIESDQVGHLKRWENSVHTNDSILHKLKNSATKFSTLIKKVKSPNASPHNQIRRRKNRH